MQSVSFERLLANLDEVLAFCADTLKLRDAATRSRFTIHHKPLIERLCAAVRTNDDEESQAVFSSNPVGFSMAITEAEELAQLLPFCRFADAKVLRPKVERALLGPGIPMDEDENSSRGRNALFELVMAAKLKHAGLEPVLGEHPDLACEIDGRRLLIECKRPTSERAVRRRIKDAGAQLSTQLKSWKAGAGTRGVIAISLTKIVNPGDKFLNYRDVEEGRRFLGDSLQALQEQYESPVMDLPPKIIGLLWHGITPAVDNTAKMFAVGQFTVVQGINRTSPNDSEPLRLLHDRIRASFEDG